MAVKDDNGGGGKPTTPAPSAPPPAPWWKNPWGNIPQTPAPAPAAPVSSAPSAPPVTSAPPAPAPQSGGAPRRSSSGSSTFNMPQPKANPYAQQDTGYRDAGASAPRAPEAPTAPGLISAPQGAGLATPGTAWWLLQPALRGLYDQLSGIVGPAAQNAWQSVKDTFSGPAPTATPGAPSPSLGSYLTGSNAPANPYHYGTGNLPTPEPQRAVPPYSNAGTSTFGLPTPQTAPSTAPSQPNRGAPTFDLPSPQQTQAPAGTPLPAQWPWSDAGVRNRTDEATTTYGRPSIASYGPERPQYGPLNPPRVAYTPNDALQNFLETGRATPGYPGYNYQYPEGGGIFGAGTGQDTGTGSQIPTTPPPAPGSGYGGGGHGGGGGGGGGGGSFGNLPTWYQAAFESVFGPMAAYYTAERGGTSAAYQDYTNLMNLWSGIARQPLSPEGGTMLFSAFRGPAASMLNQGKAPLLGDFTNYVSSLLSTPQQSNTSYLMTNEL